MLIWITAPCVAIGVLAAFLLLLSSVMSEELTVTSSVELPTETTAVDAIDERQLMHLPFANKLLNTCNLVNRMSSVSVGGDSDYEKAFLGNILFYVNVTRRRALRVLTNHTIDECATLHINNLPLTPTLDELQETDIKGALNKMYSSLLVHSGYSFFIHHQLVNSETSCSDNAEGEQLLASLAHDLAESQRFLACRLQLGMKTLGYTVEDVSSALNERVSDLSQCSLRSLRDCQVVKSINNFLQTIDDYVKDYVGKSRTRRTV